jgi:hypothetical protein
LWWRWIQRVALESAMTTISFGLSATFPGQTQGQPWDADWTALATALAWIDTVTQEANGESAQPPDTTYNITNSESLDVPVQEAPGEFEQDTITVDYGTFSLAAAVSIVSLLTVPASGPEFTEQDITLNSPWNSIKDVEVSTISSQDLHVTGFVDTWINAPSDNSNHTVSIDEAKRGAVALGNGNVAIQIDVAANEYSWSSHFNVNVGNGNDIVNVMPEAFATLANLSAPAGWTFNKTPQLTTADITVGNGNDTIGLAEISGTVHVGSGNDTINISDGNSTVWLGAGSDSVVINTMNNGGLVPWAYDTQVGSSTIHVGAGQADITIDDTTPAWTPVTTIDFIHGETGGSTLGTADVIRYGHVGPSIGEFVGGDLSALTIDLTGYSPGSTVSLGNTPPGAPMLLQIHDAATGSIDAVTLYAGVTGGAVLPHVRFT